MRRLLLCAAPLLLFAPHASAEPSALKVEVLQTKLDHPGPWPFYLTTAAYYSRCGVDSCDYGRRGKDFPIR